MMGSSSREGYHHEAKQEGSDDMNKSKVMIPSSSSISTSSLLSSSRQWSAFRNPRIVRVSRSFGGKDRHSKVCTIRGLRDRRIRLSVPTAIQLYELQDKLGLNQPSKVIDWLLEATKLDIGKLPPLQFPTHGLFNISSSSQQFLHPYNHHQNSLLFPHHHDNNANNSVVNSSLGAFYDPTNYYPTYQNLMMAAATKSSSRFCWDTNSNMSMDYSMLSPPSSSRVLKGKELLAEKGKWIIKTNGEQDEEEKNNNNHQDDEVSATSTTTQRLFPPLHGLLNNATSSSSYGGFSYYHHNSSSEHSNSLSLSQFVGSHGLLMLDPHTISGNGVYQFASSSAVAATTPPPPSLFSPYAQFVTTSSSMENNNNNNSDPIPRQFNHIHQFMNSSPQVLPHYIPSLHHHSFNSPVRPFPPPLFSSKLLDSNDDDNNNNRSQSDNKG